MNAIYDESNLTPRNKLDNALKKHLEQIYMNQPTIHKQ